ncbi:MAG: domain containing protein, partial [Bacteroidetes bacterium]|nr:domain containing protein [Bacteroidota bacterium]
IELFSVWVPSAITPDGDGQNDKFFFFSLNKLEEIKFEVYNKWGTKLFYFYEPSFTCYQGMEKVLGWDGTYEGKDVPIGAYTWRLSYQRPGNSRVYDKTGTINIVR